MKTCKSKQNVYKTINAPTEEDADAICAHAAADPSQSDLHRKARTATNINSKHTMISKSSNIWNNQCAHNWRDQSNKRTQQQIRPRAICMAKQDQQQILMMNTWRQAKVQMSKQATHQRKNTPMEYAHAAADPSQSDLHGKARQATNINVEHTKIGKRSNV